MLRGSYQARIDEKGRLHIPAQFRAELEQNDARQFYITSLDGQYALIYPLEEWNKLEEKLQAAATFNKTRHRFSNKTNYYGQLVEMDKQGRVLIPPILREKAEIAGEVKVLGNLTFLEVWNLQRLKKEVEESPMTPDDEQLLNQLGI
jgi:MraZ protein